jgi:hypothetical protein
VLERSSNGVANAAFRRPSQTPVRDLEWAITQITDELEASLSSHWTPPIGLLPAGPSTWSNRSAIEADFTRAMVAAVREVAARARTRSGPPEALPPDLAYLARLLAVGRASAPLGPPFWMAFAQELWQRLTDAAERNLSDPAERWKALKAVTARLAPHLLRLCELSIREHERQLSAMRDPRSSAQSPVVIRVLQGEWIDRTELGYDVGGEHLGLISPADSSELRRELTSRHRCEVLSTPGPQGVNWMWIGGDHVPADALIELVSAWHRELGAAVAFGEPAALLQGFRATHDEALEAWAVASAVEDGIVRYRDVALLIALLRDRSLGQMFLDRELGPLAGSGKRETDLRHVAQAYLESAQNTVATASKLGCNRRTVERKLQQAELLLGHLLRQRSGEVLVALRLAKVIAGGTESVTRTGPTADRRSPDSATGQHGGFTIRT